MARYKYQDPSQGLFLNVNLKDQLLPGSFEWTLDYLIDRTDLSLFCLAYNNDEKGAPAYNPSVLLKIIFYCYSRGIITSRPIEQAAKTNVVIKALASDAEPDHDTIAHFISSNSDAIKDLFTQILIQCSQLGLINGEMFAIDGCKLPSNTSREWSGSIGELKKKKADLQKLASRIIEQHKELDKSESAKKIQKPFKKTMGDDEERRQRHIDRIERKIAKLDAFLKTAEKRIGSSAGEVQSNITDPQSARIKSSHGYIQGYNGIAIADSAHQIIVSAEAFGSGSESQHFPQMLDSLEENMRTVTGKEEPLKKSLVTGDTGFFSENNLQEAKKRNINVLIPDQQFRRRDPYFDNRKGHKVNRFTAHDFTYNKENNTFICPNKKVLIYKGFVKLNRNSGDKYQASPGDCKYCKFLSRCVASRGGKTHMRTLYLPVSKNTENLSDKMRNKIDDPAYRELYSRRMQIIEPVFADIRYCKGMNRFSLRTKGKVNIQWLLFCMVHNIAKCIHPLELGYGN
jgi:transposase